MTRTVVILAAGQGTRISRFRKGTPKPLVRLCGMSLIERTIRSAERGGSKRFVVVLGHRGDEIRSALGDGSRFGVQIQYADNDRWDLSNGLSVLAARSLVQDEFVLAMADHVVDQGTYNKLHEINLGADGLALVTDARIKTIFDLDDATKVQVEGDRIRKIGKNLKIYNTIDTGLFICSPKLFDVLEKTYREMGDASVSDGVQHFASAGKAKSVDIGSGWWQDVDAGPAYRHAEKLLLQSMRKPTDVFVSRVFNRPISLFITKYLCRTSIRPDFVSFIGMAAGLMSPLFLIQGEYWGFVLGALAYHMSSVLDGCDGELARLKFRESKRGEWVDTIADVISHGLFAFGLVIGLYVSTLSSEILVLGLMAFAGMTSLLYVMFQYLRKVAHKGSLIVFERDYVKSVSGMRDFSTNLARFLKPLLRRATFAFLFLVLTIIDHPEWILFLMAFGTNLATGLVYLTFRRKLRAMAAVNVSQ